MKQGFAAYIRIVSLVIIFMLGPVWLTSCSNPLDYFNKDSAEWQVKPGELVFEHSLRNPKSSAKEVVISNTGTAGDSFRLSTKNSWIDFYPDSGWLEPGEEATLRVNVAPCKELKERSGVVTIRGGRARAGVRVVDRCIENVSPRAELSADPAEGEAPLEVTFTLKASDHDGDKITCNLDFGDGGDVSKCSGRVEHTYRRSGTYTATFTVEDSYGAKVEKSLEIAVKKGGDPGGGYDIKLIFIHKPSDAAVLKAFNKAAARWSRVITADIRDVQVEIPKDQCLKGNPGYKGKIDDLLIVADVAKIDGEGGVLGKAGPCGLRGGETKPDYNLPFFGVMKFDSADLAKMKKEGILEQVILHEMAHVLGIGTLWESGPFHFLNYESSSCMKSNNITYKGKKAMDAYHKLGAKGEVPVENTGGAGTKCGHWRESVFDSELMTGWADPKAPLSRVTIGALEDFGYEVDYNQADPYSLPKKKGAAAQSTGELIKEILIFPEPAGP